MPWLIALGIGLFLLGVAVVMAGAAIMAAQVDGPGDVEPASMPTRRCTSPARSQGWESEDVSVSIKSNASS